MTEDFELSVHAARARLAHALRARGARARARARGHGVLRLPAAALGARLPGRDRPRAARAAAAAAAGCSTLLSASYFLSGWTVLVYMAFPVVRILTGEQPLAAPSRRPVPAALRAVLRARAEHGGVDGRGAYTFRAFALQSASFWIHVHASLLALLRRPGRFVVTPKRGADGRQPRAVAPALAAAFAVLCVAVLGLVRGPTRRRSTTWRSRCCT